METTLAVAEVRVRAGPCLEGNIWRSYVIRGLACSLALTIPTVALLWQSCGLTIERYLFLQTLFAIVNGALEVPGGYVADLKGRKNAILLGAVMLAIGALVYSVADTFLAFLVGEVLLAMGISLVSGADQALLFDSLAELGREAEFSGIWGKAIAIESWSAAAGFLFGGFLGVASYRLPNAISAGLFVVLFVVARGLVEPQRVHLHVPKGHLHEVWKVGCFCFREKRELGWLILFCSLVLAFNQVTFWLYPPYLALSGVPAWSLGPIYCSLGVLGGVFSTYAHRLEGKVRLEQAALLTVAVGGGGLLLLGWWICVASFSLFTLQTWVRSVMRVTFSNYLNRHATSAHRATILSVKNMSDRIFYTAALLLTAPLVGAVGVQETLLWLGALLVLLGAAALRLRPQK